MLARLWRKGDPSALLVGMQTGAATVERVWNFLKKLKMELPFDPAIPLLGLYLRILKHQSKMFIAAQFTIAKYWKQPKCPSVKEWIEKLVYLHNGILYSRKEEGAHTLFDSMDGTGEDYDK